MKYSVLDGKINNKKIFFYVTGETSGKMIHKINRRNFHKRVSSVKYYGIFLH